jgi:hypothetical protein
LQRFATPAGMRDGETDYILQLAMQQWLEREQ